MNNGLVLIVDDVTKNLQLMGTILRNKGYDIALATSGMDALETLKDTQPDLILLDIMMPEMDGFEVCNKLKQNERFRDIPVIFLTGKSATDDIVKGLKAGAADYVTKPFNTAELLLRVKTQIALKKSKDQLLEKNRELQQLNAAKDKFFSIISHDLKSPFQGLIGLTELLHEDINSMGKDDIHEFAKMIHESARNLLNLLENLLEWAVLEQNKQHCEPEKTDLANVIEKSIKLFHANITAKNITLNNTVEKPLLAWVDKNMIDTVIRNLLSNAIKYTPEDGQIELTADRNETGIILSISDSGIGMNEKTRKQLFRIGETTSQPGTNNEKGTGLGLLICEELVHKNNGFIDVKSAPGKGSTFTITLPVSGDQ